MVSVSSPNKETSLWEFLVERGCFFEFEMLFLRLDKPAHLNGFLYKPAESFRYGFSRAVIVVGGHKPNGDVEWVS